MIGGSKMRTIQFKCELLSDVIINQKAATEGNQQTLDFIPGSNFLGIASSIYDDLPEENQILVFHSGKIRFGDAHPSKGNKRSLRIPSSFYYPKLSAPSEECYVHHEIENFKELNNKQLKQCRSGFYEFENKEAKEVKISKSFAIKSAYDRDRRRSADEQMYGYQSIDKGVSMLFELAYDDDVQEEVIKKVCNALIGKKRVGRSRTAQYGLVEISKLEFKGSTSNGSKSNYLVVYADGRLIFLDNNGQPTFAPKIEDFGLKSGTINWSKSQIRTFQYSPWNYKRSCRDTDRCGIEKGSVFVIENAVKVGESHKFLGNYQNEGFGKVIYNPDFLETDKAQNGKTTWKIVPDKKEKAQIENVIEIDNALTQYLKKQKQEEESESKVYETVNSFVEKYGSLFKGKVFASQWGSIRSIAMQYPLKGDFERELFTKKVQKNGKPEQFAYLTHGVAKEKWDERNRRKIFEDEFFKKISDDMIQFAVINLAAEMAKICRRTR